MTPRSKSSNAESRRENRDQLREFDSECSNRLFPEHGELYSALSESAQSSGVTEKKI
jgi:hypothetical protein